MKVQELNKQIVRRFNEEFIEKGDVKAFEEIVAPSFVNHTALPGSDNGPKSAFDFIMNVLRPAFPDLKVVIHDQVAEADKVVTRKSFIGTHQTNFMGMPPSGKEVCLNVMDIIVLKERRYTEHWSIRDFQDLYNKQ